LTTGTGKDRAATGKGRDNGPPVRNLPLAGIGFLSVLSNAEIKCVSGEARFRPDSVCLGLQQEEQPPGGRERERSERPEEARGTGPTTDRPLEARPARPSGAPEARDDRADLSGGGGREPISQEVGR
jgi:hypothetical protein